MTRGLCVFIYLFLFYATERWGNEASTCSLEGGEIAEAQNRTVCLLRIQGHYLNLHFSAACFLPMKIPEDRLREFTVDFFF